MNRMALIMVCLVLVFSMVSCDDQDRAVGYGSLSVEVSNDDGSKTVRPTDESLAFASYRIEGRHRTIEGRTVDENFTDGKIEIDHLETGDWEFMVEGLNKDKVVLAKSDTHIVTIKANGTAKETYTLDWIEGHGTLSLSVKVQTSRVSTIECKLYDEDDNETGTYVMTKDDSKLNGEGFLVFEHSFTNVPTGSYDATMTMKDKDGGMIGRALHPSIHIHDSLVSSYGFSWENFRNLLPSVDVPKVTNIGEGETTVSCDSTILLGTEEDGTTIFYSLDGKSYSKYQEGAIDLSAMGNLNDSITVWTYAEKANLNKSAVAEYAFNIEHNSIDRDNPVYTWNAIEGGYECIATSKCKYHTSIECETEKADVSYEVLVDSTEHEEGKCRYTAAFEKEWLVKDEVVPTKHKLVHHTAKTPMCAEIGWDSYDTCTMCEYTTYKEISVLGHNFVHHEAKAPTCIGIGWNEYNTCSRCSYTSYDEIPAYGHDKIHHEAKEPTCTEIGWSAYDTCTRCEYTTYREIPATGHKFVDFICTICKSRQVGPSGGYVFYDKGKYSGNPSWRYLEAAPADLCIVDGKPTIDSTIEGYSDGTFVFVFGYYRKIYKGKNLCVNGETTFDYSCTGRLVGDGYKNTYWLLVCAMGDTAYTESSGCNLTKNYAARLCYELEYEVNGKIFDDWFLPSRDELAFMYSNLANKGLGSFSACSYWSSSEGSAGSAWGQSFSSGNQDSYNRSNGYRVRPIRAF